MSYVENSVWSNSTTNFANAEEARADMLSYLPEPHNSYDKPEAENVSFNAATQTLSFTRSWNSDSDAQAFRAFSESNDFVMGEWTNVG